MTVCPRGEARADRADGAGAARRVRAVDEERARPIAPPPPTSGQPARSARLTMCPPKARSRTRMSAVERWLATTRRPRLRRRDTARASPRVRRRRGAARSHQRRTQRSRTRPARLAFGRGRASGRGTPGASRPSRRRTRRCASARRRGRPSTHHHSFLIANATHSKPRRASDRSAPRRRGRCGVARREVVLEPGANVARERRGPPRRGSPRGSCCQERSSRL